MNTTAEGITKALGLREQALEEAQAEADSCAIEWAKTDAEYRQARAVSHLKNEGPEHIRRAAAEKETADQDMARMIAQAKYNSARSNVANKREILAAGRTVASAIKTEMELASSPLRT